jgi:hypothetical protein
MNWHDIALIIVLLKLLLASVDGYAEVNSLIIILMLRGYNSISSYGGALGGLRVA